MTNFKKIDAVNSSTAKSVSYHVPVLLKETIDELNIKADGVYVDCTFGGGGHASAILQKLNGNGKLIAFDQDAESKKNLPDDKRIIFIPQNFRHIQRFLRLEGIKEVDGILADLGVSSHQFDEAERGFSIRFNAALDMRMDLRQQITAAEILKSYSEKHLHKMFEQFGEVTNAKTLARVIVEQRAVSPIQTISELKNAVHSIVKGNPQKYFAQVFQALRIEVNDEFGALRELLQQCPPLLKSGGRVAIITFHSLEDRIVKNFFRSGTLNEVEADEIYGVKGESLLKVITKKPLTASAEEVKINSRSRSAKLRAAEKK
jgi:16S rRNA (cytosine1402-N4)-methyltransferase